MIKSCEHCDGTGTIEVLDYRNGEPHYRDAKCDCGASEYDGPDEHEIADRRFHDEYC